MRGSSSLLSRSLIFSDLIIIIITLRISDIILDRSRNPHSALYNGKSGIKYRRESLEFWGTAYQMRRWHWESMVVVVSSWPLAIVVGTIISFVGWIGTACHVVVDLEVFVLRFLCQQLGITRNLFS